MIQLTFPLTGPSSVGAVRVYTSEHLPCGGPELVNTNVYGQLIAWQELMSSSKQPYGEETMVIPICRWSPALNKDRSRYEVDSLGIPLYHLPPEVGCSLRAVLMGFSCALAEPGSSVHCLCPHVTCLFHQASFLNGAMTLPFLVASFP